MSGPAEDPRAALARLIAAEGGITPPASRKAANWAAVVERAAASPTATAASTAATSTRAGALLVGGLAVGLGLAALWPDPSPAPRAPVVASAETSRSAAPTTDATSVIEETEDPLGTIREAYLELRARRPAAALAASERYIRRWPDGMLIEEAEAARVLALCALEHGDAESARQAFLRRWPRSLHGDRLRNNCRPMTDRQGPRTPGQ